MNRRFDQGSIRRHVINLFVISGQKSNASPRKSDSSGNSRGICIFLPIWAINPFLTPIKETKVYITYR